MNKFHPKKETFLISLGILLIAALLSALDGTGHWFRGWFAYSVLLALGVGSIYGVWRGVKAERKVTSAALTAFLMRLVIGVALALLLPIIGYQNSPEHQSGYVFTDAYIRDGQAWELATSGNPLSQAFSGQYSGDQYGGMLAVSALTYRALSPDAHRPFLILILGATVSAWGILCLWKTSRTWFGDKTALLAAWIFALYPESVLLGSSQMREAFVIPAIAMSFYGLTQVQEKKKAGWFWLILSALILFPIQPLAGFISFSVLLGIWLLDPATLQSIKQRQTLIVIFLSVGILFVTMLVVSSILTNLPSVKGSGPISVFLTWFQNNFMFQSSVMEQASGMFQNLLDSFGEQWRWLIVLVYGIAQPVLPAVVGDPSAAWIMRIIGFLRAAGWYALALFLVYGTLGALRGKGESRRVQLIWISILNWAWIMVAALNAGADQWDNPRYRSILLVWQVLLAAWAWEWARSRRDAWLWRWFAVEAVFVGLFTEWYLGRYYPGFPHLDIKLMILIILVISGLILVGGWIWDRRHKIRTSIPDSRL
jgi:Dolichyl-phosphate-mannose-protein mannosyltransferase